MTVTNIKTVRKPKLKRKKMKPDQFVKGKILRPPFWVDSTFCHEIWCSKGWGMKIWNQNFGREKRRIALKSCDFINLDWWVVPTVICFQKHLLAKRVLESWNKFPHWKTQKWNITSTLLPHLFQHDQFFNPMRKFSVIVELTDNLTITELKLVWLIFKRR